MLASLRAPSQPTGPCSRPATATYRATNDLGQYREPTSSQRTGAPPHAYKRNYPAGPSDERHNGPNDGARIGEKFDQQHTRGGGAKEDDNAADDVVAPECRRQRLYPDHSFLRVFTWRGSRRDVPVERVLIDRKILPRNVDTAHP
jgi:hypothetical protein